MADTEETTVIFRTWLDEPKTCIALFPYEPGTNDLATCQSFEHVGQHGSAHLAGVMERTRAATEREATELAVELQCTPYQYKLRVRKRTPDDAYAIRAGQTR
jgi:hypothetical protein